MLLGLPRKSLGGGCQKSIPAHGIHFKRWRSPLKALLNEFTPSNTLVWCVSKRRPGHKSHTVDYAAPGVPEFRGLPEFGGFVAKFAPGKGYIKFN